MRQHGERNNGQKHRGWTSAACKEAASNRLQGLPPCAHHVVKLLKTENKCRRLEARMPLAVTKKEP